MLFGRSYSQAVTFDDTGRMADAAIAFSQSTNPASPYYADQTRAFSNKQLRRFPFTDAAIAADAVGSGRASS